LHWQRGLDQASATLMGAGLRTGACGDQQVPCFDCCDVDGQRTRGRTPNTMRTLREPGYEVELAVSALAGLKGAAGYHSSVLVAGEEYWFSTMGIMHSPNISSHKKNPHMQRHFVGLSKYSGADLVEFFDHHFPPGHYDLLRKNCNSFSDCALYFLCEQRLSLKYRTMELFGKLADDHAGVIQSISAGEYVPNPQAMVFDMEAVLAEIDSVREYEMASEVQCELPHASTAKAPKLQKESLDRTLAELITPPGSEATSRELTTIHGENFGPLPEPKLDFIGLSPPKPKPAIWEPASSRDDENDACESHGGSCEERPAIDVPDPLGVTRPVVVTAKKRVKLTTWEELRVPPSMMQAPPPVAAGCS